MFCQKDPKDRRYDSFSEASAAGITSMLASILL